MPTVRSKLKGDHFAIAMLGFASAVKVIISNTKNEYVNGALGVKNIPKLTNWWVVLIIGGILIYLLWNFVNSAYGRNCRAVREQEVAAEIMGVNTSKTKLTAVLINAFCTAIGGGLFGFYTTIIAPTMFTQNQSSNHLIAVVFGGINSITGPVLSSFALAILPEVLRAISNWRLVIYGVLIVIIMLVKPEGLLGYKELNFRWVKPLYARLTKKKSSALQNGSNGGKK
jgi:branched-chain amino acid transport system permease protein